MDLALDDIIAKTKAAKRGRGTDSSFKSDGVRRTGGGRGGGQRTGGSGNRNAAGFSKSVPGGKWRHDKFAENNSGAPSHRESGRVGGPVLGGANRKVRINLTNLAPTVLTADLEELFAEFNIDSAVIHFDETGRSLGSGDVTLRKNDALKALTQFKGVAVDGQALVMNIVEGGTGSIFDRVQKNESPVIRRVSNGGSIQKSNRPSSGASGRRNAVGKKKEGGYRNPLDRMEDDNGSAPKGGRGGGRGKKAQLSEADLDAELDAYMKK